MVTIGELPSTTQRISLDSYPLLRHLVQRRTPRTTTTTTLKRDLMRRTKMLLRKKKRSQTVKRSPSCLELNAKPSRRNKLTRKQRKLPVKRR